VKASLQKSMDMYKAKMPTKKGSPAASNPRP
jgi:hypothetical protein